MASVLKQGQVVATACRLVHTLLIIHFQFALYPLSFQSCPVSLSFSQAGLLTHLAGISKNEHHTYRLLYKNVLGLQAGPFFFFFFFLAWTQTWPLSLRKDLALLLPTLGIPNQTACSQCLAFPLLATPGNHLLGQVSFPGTQWLTWFYTCFVLHKRNSTRILHKRNLGKSYAGLWKWSQLSR